MFNTEIWAQPERAGDPGEHVCPGSILIDRQGEPARYAEYVAHGFPMGRLGTGEEVADVVVFLASPRSHWIDGHYIEVDALEQPFPAPGWDDNGAGRAIVGLGKTTEDTDMMMRILWPVMQPEFEEVARDAVGAGFETTFRRAIDAVSDADWAAADAVVGPYPGAGNIGKLERCRIYVKAAVGFDEVDAAGLGGMGIAVSNTPDYGTREVADHAMALVMTLSKSVAYHDQMLREDLKANWRPAHNPFGRRLSVCTFGVVGAGRIGTAAMRRAAAFDMDVVFFDPFVPNGYELALGVRRADSLAELMGQCDIVSVHAPLNADTRGLVGKEAFAVAKKGLILVNTARGGVVDVDALYDAMKDGTVLAAGLDVLPEEPADPQRRLIKAWQDGEAWLKHRLVLTPHSAFYTPESMRDIRFLSSRTAARYLRDGRLENCVNRAFLVTPR